MKVLLKMLLSAVVLLTATTASAQLEIERRVAEVFRIANPSVVNITARTQGFHWFQGPVTQEGTGSGFVYDRSGHIVTNFHVIHNAEELHVSFANGEIRSAEIVGADPSNDLAVIRVDGDPGDLEPLEMGDSGSLEVGRFVVAVGHPFGLDQTLTTGVVSGLGRVMDSPDQGFIGEIIQTDAAINRGNSGGPLLNLEGRVIGVNSAIVSPSGASAGVGYAIPAATVERVVPELIRNGRYPHPHLGVSFVTIPRALARTLNRAGVPAPENGGLMIRALVRGGAAEKAGLKAADRVGRVRNLRVPYGGDYVVSIDGIEVESERDLMLLLETRYRVGDEVQIGYWRDSQVLSASITLMDRDAIRRRR